MRTCFFRSRDGALVVLLGITLLLRIQPLEAQHVYATYFDGIPGVAVDDLEAAPTFPNNPSSSLTLTAFEIPLNRTTNYGVRLPALLVPPATGVYRFFIAADDNAELWLSSDASPANKMLIATEPQWNASRQFVTLERRDPLNPENRSAPIFLVADTTYYVEALMKQGIGDDNLAVAWEGPSLAPVTNGSPPIAGIFLRPVAGEGITPPIITSQPRDTATCEGLSATFRVSATGTAPISYRWLFNGATIPGATNFSYAIGAANLINIGSYSVVLSNALGTTPSSAALLTVNQAPVITNSPTSLTVCSGQSASFTVTASGTAPLYYQWSLNGINIPGGTNSTLTINPISAGAAGTYNVAVANGCGTVNSRGYGLTVNQAPVVTSPPSNAAACSGQTAGFTVMATGSQPLSYQWRLNGNTIVGATNSSYTINQVSATNAGIYSVVVNNACGSTSNSATLTAVQAPVVTAQPQTLTVCAGQNASFSVTATGTVPLTYQWRLNGLNISGATSPTYAISSVTISHAGTYSVLVSNACGSTTSSSATLSVNQAPAITTQPQNITVCAGQNASFSITASGTASLTYQWRLNGVTIVGATNAAFTTNPANETNAGIYSVVVGNACGFAISTNGGILTVDQAPVVTAQPQNLTVCAGQSASFSVTATAAGPLMYQWRLNGVNIAGATNPTYIINSLTVANTGNYSVVVSNACGTTTSSGALLTVNQAPTVTTQPQNLTVCAGQSPSFSVTATGAGPLTYQWRLNGLNIAGATNPAYPINSVTVANAGTYSVVVSNACGSTISSGALLAVNQAPTLTSQPQNLTVCAGQSASLSVTASGAAPLTYQWQLNGVIIAGATNATYTINSVTVANAGTYSLAVSNACGSTTSSGAVLLVNQAPSITAQPQNLTVCAGQSASFSVTANGAGPLTYQWRLNGLNIPGATSPTYAINSVTVATAGTYSVVVSNACGGVISGEATLTLCSITGTACRGFLERAVYANVSGIGLSAVRNHPSFPNHPTTTDYLSSFSSGSLGENYGLRVRGYIIPSETADYQFLLHSADAAELFLSVDDNPSNATRIALASECCKDVATAYLPLVSGKWYFVEAVLWAGQGLDYLEVLWRHAGVADYQVIGGANLGTAAVAGTSRLTITNQPTSQAVPLNSFVALSVGADSNFSPIFYQWQKRVGPGFVDLLGANSNRFVIRSASFADQGQYRCLLSIPGICTNSSSVDVTVTTNTTQAPCSTTSRGTNFWLTIPGNLSPDLGTFVQPHLCINGSPGISGIVEIAGLGFQATYTIGATRVVTVLLPVDADLGNSLEHVENKGIHVTASADVSVVLFNYLQYSTDAYSVMPTEALGRDHIVLGYGNVHANIPDLAGSEFAVVATEDGTDVEIILTGPVGSYQPGDRVALALDRGQTYQMRATNEGRFDFTGTSIVSSKPIGVFAGHRCAAIPSSDVFFCNYVAEQIPPTQVWGTNYLTVPFVSRSNDTFRCLAMSNDTTVFTNNIAAGTINRGQFLEFLLHDAARINSTRPVLTAQFANSSDYDRVIPADPTMIVLPSTGRYLTNYLVCAHSNFNNFLSIASALGTNAIVRLDGVSVPLTLQPSGFASAQVAVSPGTHDLSGNSPFLVTVYGFSPQEFDAYGYAGGLSSPDLTPPTLSCPGNLEFDLGTGCQILLPPLFVTASDNCTPASNLLRVQSPPVGTRLGPGTYQVKHRVTDSSGNAAECERTVIVRDSRLLTLVCASNIVMECTNGGGNIVSFDLRATNACGSNLILVCYPPSGSQFSPGTTPVNCLATDGAGGSARCSFSVIVRDTTAPYLLCPSNIVAVSEGPTGTKVVYAVTARDNCDPEVSILCEPPVSHSFLPGVTPVTCRAIDGSGNESRCSFTVTIAENGTRIGIVPHLDTLDLTFFANSGVRYTVQFSTDLSGSGWANLTSMTGSGSVISVTVPFSRTLSQRFYRLTWDSEAP